MRQPKHKTREELDIEDMEMREQLCPEPDYGGAFDGFTVSSDADGGL